MSVEELYKNGYTILPTLINENTCDNLKKILDQKLNKLNSIMLLASTFNIIICVSINFNCAYDELSS